MKFANLKSIHLCLSLLALAGAASAAAPAPASKETSAAISLARQLNQAFIEVADKASPSVVVIRVASKRDAAAMDEEGNSFWEMLPRQFRKQFEEELEKRKNRQKGKAPAAPQFNGQGSGVVIREDGYILTNGHVVKDAEKIKVRFRDGKEYDAEVRGIDTQSDLAVLKVNATGLTAAKFADSSKTRVGEFAIAIGAPFDLDYSVTFGHVSAKGRSHIIPDATMDQDFIQTDANINPGNSGGPLVNIDGEVIGINTLIRGLRTGIGFAIPSNMAREVSEKLISDGKFTRSWLGIVVSSLSEDPDVRDLVKGVSAGVVVKSIPAESPVTHSDLKPFDVITTVDGVPVVTVQDLRNQIRMKRAGSNVTLDVNRNGKKMQVKVKPGEMPATPTFASNRRPAATDSETHDIGVTVKALTRDLAEEFGVKLAEGVIVIDIEDDSVAQRKGLKPGDIITEINHKVVTNLKQFRDTMKAADMKKGVIVNFLSQGVSKFEVLKDGGE